MTETEQAVIRAARAVCAGASIWWLRDAILADDTAKGYIPEVPISQQGVERRRLKARRSPGLTQTGAEVQSP